MAEACDRPDDIIANLLKTIETFLQGEFQDDLQELPEIDAEGLLSTLAQKINCMLGNIQTVHIPLTSAGEHTPQVLSSARDVVELMEHSTDAVLDRSDDITRHLDILERYFNTAASGGEITESSCRESVNQLKSSIYDIIASQSYQDVARQRLEKMIRDLNLIRDWLIEVLLVLNIRKDCSAANVEKKKKLLQNVRKQTDSPESKQDLVDKLLAEFGF
jgi:chemotaxis protein CheZ